MDFNVRLSCLGGGNGIIRYWLNSCCVEVMEGSITNSSVHRMFFLGSVDEESRGNCWQLLFFLLSCRFPRYFDNYYKA